MSSDRFSRSSLAIQYMIQSFPVASNDRIESLEAFSKNETRQNYLLRIRSYERQFE